MENFNVIVKQNNSDMFGKKNNSTVGIKYESNGITYGIYRGFEKDALTAEDISGAVAEITSEIQEIETTFVLEGIVSSFAVNDTDTGVMFTECGGDPLLDDITENTEE